MRPFDTLARALSAPLRHNESAVLVALLLRADEVTAEWQGTSAVLGRLAGGVQPIAASTVRSRVAPVLEAAGLLTRETVPTAQGVTTRWRVDVQAVSRLPRAMTAHGTPTRAGSRWRADVDAAVAARASEVDPATREQARRAGGVRSNGAEGCAPLERRGALQRSGGARSVGAGGALQRNGGCAPTGRTPYIRNARGSSSFPFPPPPPTPRAEESHRAALAAVLMGMDSLEGVQRVEGGLLVTVRAETPRLRELVQAFASEHGVPARIEVASHGPDGLWHRAKARLRLSLAPENFATYIEPLDAAKVDGGVELTVADPFFAHWIAEHYAERIVAAAQAAGLGDGALWLVAGEQRRQLDTTTTHTVRDADAACRHDAAEG